jgi:heat shock protein HslJ
VRLRRIAILLPLVLVSSAFSACGDDDGGSDTSGGGSQDPAALEGESWILTQMLTAGGQTQIVEVGVSAEFDGSTISGTAGCNAYHASYEASGGEISFGPIAATKKVCPEAEQSTEDRYLQLLGEIGSYEVRGRSMSMNETDGTPVLQFMQG